MRGTEHAADQYAKKLGYSYELVEYLDVYERPLDGATHSGAAARTRSPSRGSAACSDNRVKGIGPRRSRGCATCTWPNVRSLLKDGSTRAARASPT